jgi:site-specific recombinase XerD
MQTETIAVTANKAVVKKPQKGHTRGVYQRKPGEWWVRHVDSQGRLRREKAGTWAAARALYIKRKNEALEGKKLPENLRHVNMPTLRGFADRFIGAIQVQCSKKPQTIRFYALQMAALLEFAPLADARLSDIDEAVIQAFVEHRASKASIATVNRGLATLRRGLRLAQRWKVIDRVPHIRLLAGEHQREFVLSREQEASYLAACAQPLRDCATLMLDTGLRVGEALALEWRDVRLLPEPGFVQVHDGKSRYARRAVPLTTRSRGMLETRRKGAQSFYVFAESDGRAMLTTSLAHIHAKVRRSLGHTAEFVLHSLRHTFCTRLGEAGTEAFLIQRLAGHHSVTVSERYVHPTPESAVLAIRRLDAANNSLSGVRSGTTTDTSVLALPVSPCVDR